MNNIIKAAQFAAKAHNGQTRKYTNAGYITHPLRVASAVMIRDDATETMVVSALLHDVLEDTPVTYQELSHEFGEDVAVLVQELTKVQYTNCNRAERVKLNNERLRRSSWEARTIKLIDRLDNLKEIDCESSFCVVYCNETMDLINIIGDVDPKLTDEIRRAISNLLLAMERY